jgi:hypothetical protein
VMRMYLLFSIFIILREQKYERILALQDPSGNLIEEEVGI